VVPKAAYEFGLPDGDMEWIDRTPQGRRSTPPNRARAPKRGWINFLESCLSMDAVGLIP
jgi:hypothetical protein